MLFNQLICAWILKDNQQFYYSIFNSSSFFWSEVLQNEDIHIKSLRGTASV